MEIFHAVVDQLSRLFGPLDLAAVGIFLALSLVLRLLIEHPPRRLPSTASLMKQYRERWMRSFAAREVRIFDSNILGMLRQGTTFFASASMLMIGGTAALVGQADRLVAVVEDIASLETMRPVWEAKLVFITLLLVDAFLKFVWAHRLFGYVAVLMGAVPEAGRADEAELERAVMRAVKLHHAAARAFNRGLRSIYFTLAALAWFMGPLFFIAASTAAAAMILRREFGSASRRALLAK